MDGLGDENIKDNTSNNKDKHRKRRRECVAPMQIENQPSNSSAKKKKTGDEYIYVNPKEEQDIEKEKDVFFLLVSKIPYQWSCEQITEYISENCPDLYSLEQLKGGDLEAGQSIRLAFTNFEKCNQARKQLRLKTVDGQKLHVVFAVPGESESDDDEMNRPLSHRRSTTQPSLSVTSQETNIDVWATEATGTYGLKPSYLESLGISPPIDKWVHVSNFRCDKSELKEALEIAGQVVICRVISVANKYAMVMYSHPLEAVQAVAILHGQKFYGQVLKVEMYKCVNKELLLPKGLVKIGPGLGENGKPLRDIVQHYDRYLKGKTNCINGNLFINVSSTNEDFTNTDNGLKQDESIDVNIEQEEDSDESNEINKYTETRGNNSGPPKTANIPRPITQTHNHNNPDTLLPVGPSSAPVHLNATSNPALMSTSFFNQPITSQLGNKSFRPGIHPSSYNICNQNITVDPRLQLPQNIPIEPRVQQPFHNPTVPFKNPRNQGPIAASTNVLAGPPNINMQTDRNVCLQPKTSSVVELSNLPLSTTFPILTEKMAQVGQVISLELTRVGCAVVRFATPSDAERCYRHYNKLFVMGNHIEVKFL